MHFISINIVKQKKSLLAGGWAGWREWSHCPRAFIADPRCPLRQPPFVILTTPTWKVHLGILCSLDCPVTIYIGITLRCQAQPYGCFVKVNRVVGTRLAHLGLNSMPHNRVSCSGYCGHSLVNSELFWKPPRKSNKWCLGRCVHLQSRKPSTPPLISSVLRITMIFFNFNRTWIMYARLRAVLNTKALGSTKKGSFR